MQPIIVFDNVSKAYPLYHHITGGLKNFLFHLPRGLESLRNSRYVAIQEISFEVYPGETIGIVGKNGAGKSTILGLIAGVLRPNVGRVLVEGRVSPLLELGAGFHFELTGRENIMLKGVLLGFTRTEVTSKIDEIIDFSELGQFIDQPIRVYSSGMLARLGFSVVANLDPEILLIDEILAVGDEKFQKKCIDRMLSFKRNGITIVFVSHVMEKVELICDRVLWVENHGLRRIGEAREVVTAYSGFLAC